MVKSEDMPSSDGSGRAEEDTDGPADGAAAGLGAVKVNADGGSVGDGSYVRLRKPPHTLPAARLIESTGGGLFSGSFITGVS